jgi:hypothetical protein
MTDRATTRLRRVTDLFVTGQALVLQDDPDTDPVLVWVNKPNAFQRAECQKDGAAAQARRVAALHEDSDEVQAALSRLETLDRDQIIEYVVSQQANALFLAAVDDVRADEKWADRLPLIDRSASLAEEGSPATPDEQAAIDQANVDYYAAVQEAQTIRLDDAKAEWADTPEEDLRKEWLETFRRRLGMGAFMEEYDKTELYYAARDCVGVRAGSDYTHTACTHQRLLPGRAAVNDLPEDLANRIRQVLTDLSMTPQDAGNSAAPVTSSAPSEQPSSAADSEASTPAVT